MQMSKKILISLTVISILAFTSCGTNDKKDSQILSSLGVDVPTDRDEVQYGKWINPSSSACEANGGHNGNSKNCYSNWENANKICHAIGGNLATIEILRKVMTDCGGVVNDYEENLKNSAYKACYHKKGFSTYFWSSTPYTSDLSEAWLVDFEFGTDDYAEKSYECFVRCLRE